MTSVGQCRNPAVRSDLSFLGRPSRPFSADWSIDLLANQKGKPGQLLFESP